MATIKTTMNLLEHINHGLKGKIVYWLTMNDEVEYGVVVMVHKGGFVIVTQDGLPDDMRSKNFSDDHIMCIDIEHANMGVYEVSSLN